MLSDAGKRQQYDQFGHAAFSQGGPGHGGFSGGFDFGDMGDMFGDIFGDFLVEADAEDQVMDQEKVRHYVPQSN